MLQTQAIDTRYKELCLELELVRDALKNSQQELDDIGKMGTSDARAQNYAYVVENAPVAVVITDARGLIEFVNPKFEEVTGYSFYEVVGKNPNILNSGETDASTYQDLWQTIQSGSQWVGVFHNRRKDGTLFWERAVISGIKNGRGEIIHFIAIKEDITEVKEEHRKLEQERLKIIQQAKMVEIGIMASGILHEVGNPIAAIRGLICDIKDTLGQIENKEAWLEMLTPQLDHVLGEVDRITGITKDISEFSYSNRGLTELVDINTLVSTTCRLVQYDGRWDYIDLNLVLDPELPPVNAIKDQVTQVLINLLSNAAYAVDQIRTRPSVVKVSTIYNEDNVYISIDDNGCGIEQKDLPRIFDNFFTSKNPGEGSGLGLTLCKSIIDNHQGTIAIDSEFGVKTDVCISLPIESELPS